MVTSPPPREPLTTFDWTAAGITASAIAALMLLPLGSFRSMFQDFGATAELPLLTRMAIVPGFSIYVALPAVAALAFALRARRPLRQRRIWFAIAFCACLLGFALCFVSMYLPIFQLAGKIKG